jgi:nucleoside-diphosphate-sugar epimerase
MNVENRQNVMENVRKVKPDVVIHTACYGGYPSEKNNYKMLNVNLNGTINIVDASISSNVPLVINTGSSSEYGKKSKPMKESDTINPETDYGISKALSTIYCTFKGSHETKILTLRLFSPYGYYERGSRLIPYMLLSCLRGSRIYLSSPSNVRDFIFIEDVINAYKLSILKRNKISSGSVFNIGYGKQYKIIDIVKIVSKVSGKLLEVNWHRTQNRSGDGVKIWQADIEKVNNILGWKPKTNIEDGISKTFSWIKNNFGLYDNEQKKKN